MDSLHLALSPSASPYQMPWPTPNNHPFLVSAPISSTAASTSPAPFRLPSLSPVASHCPPSPTASTSSLADDAFSFNGGSPSLSASSSPTICPALLFNPVAGSSPAPSPSPTAPLHSPALSLPDWTPATGGRSISRPGSTSRTAAQEALDSASLQLWLRLSTEGVAARERAAAKAAKGKGLARTRKTRSPRSIDAKGMVVGGKSWLQALVAAEARAERGRG